MLFKNICYNIKRTHLGECKMKFENYIPKNELSERSLVHLKDATCEDVFEIIHKCLHLKITESVGEIDYSLKNKHVVLITNQRLGIAQLTFRLAIDKVNGHPLTIPIGGSNIESFLSGRESVEVLSKLGVDAFVVETSVCDDALKLSQKMSPVINAYLKDSPITAISDLLTIYENQKRLTGLNACFLANSNELTSHLVGMAMCGMNLTLIVPEGEEAPAEVMDYLSALTNVTVSCDLDASLKNCDVLYIDNDYSSEYFIDKEALSALPVNACVLHSSPLTGALDADVNIMDDARCLVSDSAANVVYVLSAVLELIIGK